MYASMNGVVQDASGGSYNAATGGGLNGGSASRYENMGSSASGSGYGGGGDDANGDGSGGGMDRHGGGGDGDGDGDGDGEDNEEQRRQKKLTLACHFCRRRKLKYISTNAYEEYRELTFGRCDGHRPTCENCAKRNEVCTFDEAVRRRGPGKRTKEMRDRAAREADAAGLTNASSAGAILSPVPGPAQLTGPGLGQGPDPGLDPSQGSGPSTLAELEVKKGKKRKSEGASDGEKKPKYENSDFEGDQGYL